MNYPLPPISIGIPFYNAESTLLDAVRSVFAQTYQNWELILMDDGSTDRSLELARSIKDPRVRVYSDGENRRLAVRLNQIIELSNHDFVARMDADDLMAKDRIRRELQILVENKSIDLVSTGVLSLSDDYSPVGARSVAPTHAITPSNLLRSSHGIVHASIVARKEWFKRNKYREDLPCAEDKSLWISSFSKRDLSVSFIAEPLYFYREDSSASAEKLLRAYAVGRGIIKRDAGSVFPVRKKLVAYVRSHLQSLVVYSLTKVNRMDLIRAKRSTSRMSESELAGFIEEIMSIRSTDLPLEQS